MKAVRVYTGPDGRSHFEDFEIALETQGGFSRAVAGEPRTCLFIPLDDNP